VVHVAAGSAVVHVGRTRPGSVVVLAAAGTAVWLVAAGSVAVVSEDVKDYELTDMWVAVDTFLAPWLSPARQAVTGASVCPGPLGYSVNLARKNFGAWSML